MGAEDLVEHPLWNLPVVPFVVVVDLAAKNTSPASFSASDDFLPVQRMPWVTNQSDSGLVITLFGTSTTRRDVTLAWECYRR